MKIAILGASKPHLPLYQKAHEMGLETYCIAWAEGAYCKDFADYFFDISILDKESIVEVCKQEKIQGIISNAIDFAVPTLAYVAQECGFNGNSYQAALQATSKKLMRMCVAEAKACPQPRFHVLTDSNFSIDHYPVVVKPVDGSCSDGVSKVSNSSDLVKALERGFQASRHKELLIEEFISGQEVSVESISYHGKHYVLTITDKETTGAPYFVETAHHQPSLLNQAIQAKIKQYTLQLLDALSISNGATHTEFKITPDGQVYFIELGARGGGDFISYDLVQLSTGYDYVRGMIEVALGSFTEPELNKQAAAGVYFLSQETAYLAEYIRVNQNQAWMVDFEVEQKPLVPLKRSQDRVGYFIYQNPERIVVNNKKKDYE